MTDPMRDDWKRVANRWLERITEQYMQLWEDVPY